METPVDVLKERYAAEQKKIADEGLDYEVGLLCGQIACAMGLLPRIGQTVSPAMAAQLVANALEVATRLGVNMTVSRLCVEELRAVIAATNRATVVPTVEGEQ